MIYKEENRDLFSVDESYYLAHCISADFVMGKGIAVEFNKRYNLREQLNSYYPNFVNDYHIFNGLCLKVIDNNVLNLVTKERYWQKPTYESLTNALIGMRDFCIAGSPYVNKIAMPKIGCGLDKLEWSKVSAIIKDVFKDTDIEILVCYK